MPPTIPQPCQALADDVAALEAADQALRAQLKSLTGSAAWAALAQLGQGRDTLAQKRAELTLCIQNHSAALQGNLVVMDLTSPGPTSTANRVSHLWDLTQASASEREANPVQADTFSFNGPIPSQFGISIATTGNEIVIGPDFRSSPLTSEGLPADGSVRVEIVLGGLIRIEQDEVARLVAEFTPTVIDVGTAGGGISAQVSITTADATLTAGGLQARFSGQLDVTSVFGAGDRGPFSATGTVSIVPVTPPGNADLCDVVNASDLTIELPGVLGQLADALLPALRTALGGALITHLRSVIPPALASAVAHALVLTSLPSDVTVSVRQLKVDPSAISFQPVLGAIGTTLSTFVPPVIPPP